MEILVCERCEVEIGTFDPATLHLPLTPEQFYPLEPGFPAPFHPEMTWETLNCPVCHGRAMGWTGDWDDGVRRDQLLTPRGYFFVTADAVEKAVVAEVVESVEEPEPVVLVAKKKAPVKRKGGKKRG